MVVGEKSFCNARRENIEAAGHGGREAGTYNVKRYLLEKPASKGRRRKITSNIAGKDGDCSVAAAPTEAAILDRWRWYDHPSPS